MAAINNVSTPWEALERVQRPIRAPEKTYPPLKEGQRILGLTDDKFKELYDGAQNKIKIFYQQNPVRATTGATSYGQRVENHQSVVPDLEDQHPVLKLCSENWGAKWILKRAKQAMAVKSRKGSKIARQRKAERRARVADRGVQESHLELEYNDPSPELNAELAEIDHEAKEPELQAIGMTDSVEERDGDKHMSLVEDPKPCTSQLGCLEPDPQEVSVVDRAACTALFNMSKSWLVTGPPRHGWQRKVERGG